MPSQTGSLHATSLSHRLKKTATADILKNHAIFGKKNAENNMLYWMVYNTKTYNFRQIDVSFVMLAILKKHIDKSYRKILKHLSQNHLKVILQHEVISFIHTENAITKTININKTTLRNLPLKSNIHNIGGWIGPAGTKNIMDTFVEKIILLMNWSHETDIKIKQKLMVAIRLHNPIIDQYHEICCLYTSIKPTVINLKKIIRKRFSQVTTSKRIIRINNARGHNVGSSIMAELNPVIGIENGTVFKIVNADNTNEAVVMFQAIPINIESILYELFLDFKFLQKSMQSITITTGDHKLKQTLGDYISLCNKWGSDVCDILKPRLQKNLTDEQPSGNYFNLANTLLILPLLTILYFLIHLTKRKKSKRFKFKIPARKQLVKTTPSYAHNNIKPSKTNNKKTKQPTCRRKPTKVKKNNPRRLWEKQKVQPSKLNKAPPKTTNTKTFDRKSEQLTLIPAEIKTEQLPRIVISPSNKKSIDKLLKPTTVTKPQPHPINPQIIKNPQQNKDLNTKPYFSHKDNYTDTQVNNIGVACENILISIVKFCQARGIKILIKGANGLTPENHPNDLDLELITTKTLVDTYNMLSKELRSLKLFSNAFFPGKLINFEIPIKNDIKLDITLTHSAIAKFFQQSILISRTTALREIYKKDTELGEKIFYGKLLLPASSKNPYQHTIAKAASLSLLKHKTLCLMGISKKNIEAMITQRKYDSCINTFKYMYKNSLKYNTDHTEQEYYQCLISLYKSVKTSHRLIPTIIHYLKSHHKKIIEFQQGINKNFKDKKLAAKTARELTAMNNLFSNNQTGPTPTITQLKS